MQKLRKLIRGKKGFTLVELIVVITFITVITVAAVPGFMRSLRQSQFEKTVAEITNLFERARTQALASKLNSVQKIPPGGYGVFLDFTNSAEPTDQLATLFVDDWNNSVGADVNVDYANLTVGTRVLPDGIFTAGHDTALATVAINSPNYIRLTELSGAPLVGGTWNSALGNTLTVIFTPPYAETTILGNSATSLQNFTAQFTLVTDGSTRTLKFNRVTTSPQIFKN